jgi:hypothetical protein
MIFRMGGCLFLLFFHPRIAASTRCGQQFCREIMAFPPDLTEKPRFSGSGAQERAKFLLYLSMC